MADPDEDLRNNREEFLKQTNPLAADEGVATIWLTDGQLRFALPANTDQSAYQILDSTGAAAFVMSDLELDAQYGPFFIYKLKTPIEDPDPTDFTIATVDATVSVTPTSAEFTLD